MHYAKLARHYDRRWGRYSRRTLSMVLGQLDPHPEQHVLDVACGTGLLGAMIHSQWPEVRYTGVDLSAAMLAVAKRHLPASARIQWRTGRAETLPMDTGAVDVVTCANAFHLVGDPVAALAEFKRVLKPGGQVVIVDWCRDFLSLRIVQTAANRAGHQRRRILTLGEADQLLSAAGFEAIRGDRFKASWVWGMLCVVARRPEDAALDGAHGSAPTAQPATYPLAQAH